MTGVEPRETNPPRDARGDGDAAAHEHICTADLDKEVVCEHGR
ncbi:hypothetical protein [Mycobacterium sp. 1423905.2]|nr:hypothetical protein [Mycobacterium sp. 1423905.2]